MEPEQGYTVRAAHCSHRASDEEVYATLQRLTAPLKRAWDRLERAQRIVIKANLVWPPDAIRFAWGRRQELVDDAVFRAVLRLLRERTRAELLVADTTQLFDPPHAGEDVHFRSTLDEFGVRYIECNDPPFADYEVPGGGLMFRRYRLNPCFLNADAVVSVATLKSHNFMGVTLCTKNLFGLCPIHPENRPRTYFHHIIRLPYVLADLARILQPCLNVIDGLVGQSRCEWGGDARLSETLVAGDHVIATDACAASLMGHDPAADWPTPPFRRDRNHLRVAAESGFGTVDLSRIDFEHDLSIPVAQFDSDQVDSPETVASWRRSMCEEALAFLQHRDDLVARYPGEYVYLQDGNVLWHGPWFFRHISRRQWSGLRRDRAVWLKYLDPGEWEGERFAVYEEELARMNAS